MGYQLSKRSRLRLAAVLFLAGTTNGLFGQLLYVGNNGDATISSFVIDQDTGLLTELLPRVSTPGLPSSVVIHPSGKFVYVTNSGSANLGVGPSLAAFSIDPATGALTLVNTTPLTPGSGPTGAAIDPAGKFVFIAHAGANNISVFSLDPSTGTPSPVSGSPFASPQGPLKVVVHPNGKFAYVAANGAGQIAAFNIAAGGSLTPAAGSPFAARNNLAWMTMDAAGKFLFAAERQQNGVLVYSVDGTTGALTLVTGSPFSTSGAIQGVAVDPAGKFLYASNGGGTLHGFRIGATGTLTPIPPGFFPSGIGSFDVILDPAGKFVYVTNPQNNQIWAWAIDSSSGALTPIPVPPYPTGAAPQRGASILLSPPVLPPIIADTAVNGFSNALPGLPNAGVAQGSVLSVSGKNIGPAVEVQSPKTLDDFPLQSELGGVSMQIQSGGVTTAAIMRDVSNNQVTGIVPSTTPLGPATVTVTYMGRTTAPLPITIVTTSAGLETLSEVGGPARRALNATPDTVLSLDTVVSPTLPYNALNLPAKPGQRMVLRATGLGPVMIDETQALTQELNVPVNVIVGNKLATVISELRLIGIDYILFQLPDDAPLGCYVPVAVQAGGVTSNVASISISATGGSCSDATGLAASDIDAAQKSGNINMATIVVTHLDLGQLGVGDSADGIFARYDFNSLLSAFSPGNNGSGIRSAFGNPPLGTCTVSVGAPTKPNNPFDLPSDFIPQYLNVGQALNLNGPQGKVQLPAPDYSFNQNGNVITPGDYMVDNGTGTQAFGPFKAVLNLPPMLTWTNKDALSSVDRTQDLTVTWSGGVTDKEFALIVGLSANTQVTTGFLCAEKVSAGQFTVPAWVLSSLPASATFTNNQTLPTGLIGVGTASLTNVGRFTAPGFDFGVFTYEQATATLASYQ